MFHVGAFKILHSLGVPSTHLLSLMRYDGVTRLFSSLGFLGPKAGP